YVALQQLGFENIQVYDGSFHEWARKPDLPLEQGTIQEKPRVRPVAPAASPCVVENLPGMAPAECSHPTSKQGVLSYGKNDLARTSQPRVLWGVAFSANGFILRASPCAYS